MSKTISLPELLLKSSKNYSLNIVDVHKREQAEIKEQLCLEYFDIFHFEGDEFSFTNEIKTNKYVTIEKFSNIYKEWRYKWLRCCDKESYRLLRLPGHL